MKKAEEKRIGDLAEFDQEVSLYQLIPAGSGRALRLLRYVVDYILNNHPDRIPSSREVGRPICSVGSVMNWQGREEMCILGRAT